MYLFGLEIWSTIWTLVISEILCMQTSFVKLTVTCYGQIRIKIVEKVQKKAENPLLLNEKETKLICVMRDFFLTLYYKNEANVETSLPKKKYCSKLNKAIFHRARVFFSIFCMSSSWFSLALQLIMPWKLVMYMSL